MLSNFKHKSHQDVHLNVATDAVIKVGQNSNKIKKINATVNFIVKKIDIVSRYAGCWYLNNLFSFPTVF